VGGYSALEKDPPAFSQAKLNALSAPQDQRQAIYLAQLDRCKPASALSAVQRKGCWKKIPYETSEGLQGVMVAAGPYSRAAELTLDLKTKGWHAIYLGLHGFHSSLESVANSTSEIATLRVKLTRDRYFRRIRPENPDFASISEVFWRVE